MTIRLRTAGWLAGEQITDQALESMLGSPAGSGGTVVAAMIADGWLILDIEVARW